jgi:ABC-type branched-subunit amino acid transport system substrate-binding protein/tRNA A-37 threonylcarbamoyl transferase component Bud32
MSRRLFLLLLAVVSFTVVDCVTQYSLGALVPITGGAAFGNMGQECVVSMQLALNAYSQVMNDAGINITLVSKDTATDPIVGLRATLEFTGNYDCANGNCTAPTRLLGIVGAWASGVTLPVGYGTRVGHIYPLISYGSTATSLTTSDFGDQKTFLRTIANDAEQNPGIVALLKEHNWKAVTITFIQNKYGAELANNLNDILREANIVVLATASIDEVCCDEAAQKAEQDAVLDTLKKSGSKINIFVAYPERARAFFASDNMAPLVGEGFVWLGIGWVETGVANSTDSAIQAKLYERMEGTIGMWPKAQNSTGYQNFLNRWYGASNDDPVLYVPNAYDAASAFAIAASAVASKGGDPTNSTALLGELFALDEPNGAVGRIHFDTNGDPTDYRFGYANLRNGGWSNLGSFSTSTEAAAFDAAPTFYRGSAIVPDGIPDVPCEVGHYESPLTFKCVLCPAGTYANTEKVRTACASCDPGTYTAGVGSTICRPCEGGTYQEGRAQTACEKCEQYSYSGSKAAACTFCWFPSANRDECHDEQLLLLTLITGAVVACSIILFICLAFPLLLIIIFQRVRTRGIESNLRTLEKKTKEMYLKVSNGDIPSDLTTSFVDVELGQLIGAGARGSVYVGKWRGIQVAVKTLHPLLAEEPEEIEALRKEMELCSRLRHPNVLLLLGASPHPPNVFFLTELCEQSLFTAVVESQKNWKLLSLLQIWHGTSLGLRYLHAAGICHNDFKSSNVLLTESGTPKICDFDNSRSAHSNNRANVAGTECYCAPEVLDQRRFSFKADIYSFGMVIYECLIRDVPFVDVHPSLVWISILKGVSPEIPSWVPASLRRVLARTWLKQPEARPSIEALERELDLLRVGSSGWDTILVVHPLRKKERTDMAAMSEKKSAESPLIAEATHRKENPLFIHDGKFQGKKADRIRTATLDWHTETSARSENEL